MPTAGDKAISKSWGRVTGQLTRLQPNRLMKQLSSAFLDYIRLVTYNQVIVMKGEIGLRYGKSVFGCNI